MLIQLVMSQPQALGPIVRNTPPWVWGLFTTLLGLGLSQVRARTVGLRRVTVMPVAMVGLSVWGTISAFGSSPQLGYVLLAWAACTALMVALTAPGAPLAGTQYDAAARSFHVPGSWVPLALILGIFLTKYIVGVELALQPALALDGPYALIVGALYGVFSGIFAGRAACLWRLALRPAPINATPVLNA